ncbi:MAG: hypothetical protein J6S71_01540 [Clostridia bacterium]|nr:hypothetical protein [Clostridia bacterium]
MDENLDLELTEELPEDLPEEPEEDEKASLLSELEALRSRLETAERTAREISAGWREFTELYPEADISSLPDSFNAAIERGIPPAAAYALELRRKEVRLARIKAADQRARELSAGKLDPADDTLYSPDEVRAMPPAEVRKNIEKIRRSMKSWR